MNGISSDFQVYPEILVSTPENPLKLFPLFHECFTQEAAKPMGLLLSTWKAQCASNPSSNTQSRPAKQSKQINEQLGFSYASKNFDGKYVAFSYTSWISSHSRYPLESCQVPQTAGCPKRKPNISGQSGRWVYHTFHQQTINRGFPSTPSLVSEFARMGPKTESLSLTNHC